MSDHLKSWQIVKKQTQMVQTNTHLFSANIAVQKNAIKQYCFDYGIKYFLKNETCYEIELLNLSNKRVRCSIEIDGKIVSGGGIVLNPGEHQYVDRWSDVAKKFMFISYLVKDTPEVKNAIANNGKIEVSFFEEKISNTWTYPYFYTLPYTPEPWTYYPPPITCETSISTGITIQGSNSSQVFVPTTGSFENYPCAIYNFQILPETSKVSDSFKLNRIRKYCTECGARARSTSWKFCPVCGEKF